MVFQQIFVAWFLERFSHLLLILLKRYRIGYQIQICICVRLIQTAYAEKYSQIAPNHNNVAEFMASISDAELRQSESNTEVSRTSSLFRRQVTKYTLNKADKSSTKEAIIKR